MRVQRHMKRISRARDKVISTPHGNGRMSLSPARGLSRGVRLIVVTVFLIVLLTGMAPGVQAAVTAYQIQNILANLTLDTECKTVKITLTSHETIEMIESATAGCSARTVEDKVVFTHASSAEVDLLTGYFNNAGYASYTTVTGQSSGNAINFKSKFIGGTFKIYLYEANPSTGALIGGALDFHSETVSSNIIHEWTNLSGLTGLISPGNTFAFKMTFTPNDATSSQLTMLFGAYGVSKKQMLFNIDETVSAPPVSAAISGTITPSATEGEIVSGGKKIVIDLTNDTWQAEGTPFNDIRQDIINGLNSAGSDEFGWNNEVRDMQGVTGVVRTDSDTVTITLDAQSSYNLTTGNETITVTVPASALVTSSTQVVASPTFDIFDSTCLFTYRNKISILGTEVYGTSNLENFPVLISLTDANLKHTDYGGKVTKTLGWDIVFRGSAATPLDHEIEFYDEVNGVLVAWVRIPTLYYDDGTNTDIYIYYGNDCADTSSENPDGVWDINYVGVWHLGESGDGTEDEFADSSGVGNDGQGGSGDSGMTPAQTTSGQIGNAQDFDGSDDFVDLGESYWDGDPSGKTFMFWFQRQGAGTVGTAAIEVVLAKGAGNPFGYGFGVNESDQVFIARTNTTNAASSLTVVDDTWYHVAVVASGGNFTFYIDGSPDTPVSYTYTGDNDTVLAIGNGGQNWFNGIIDEVRVSNIARSADWIKTEHSNQNAPGSFYTYVPANEESGLPTAAKLISFTATGQDSSVQVAWETAQEVSNVGFNLYRFPATGGSPVQLNRDLIPGLISSVKGQKYTFTDTDVTRGELYYYLLEDVDLAGRGTMNGPVCVDWDGDGVPDDFYDFRSDKTSDSDIDIEEGHPENGIPVDLLDRSGSIDTVKLASFKASQQDGGVALKWQTGYELDILGFHIYREIDFQFYRITPNMVPGSVFKVGAGKELPDGQSYVFWDTLPEVTGRELYWLECTDTHGTRAYFGPVKPEVQEQQPSERLRKRFLSITELQFSKTKEYWRIRRLRNRLKASLIQKDKRESSFRQIIPRKRFEPRLPPDEEQYVLSAKSAVKISVKEEGWYSVGQPELVAAGLDSRVDPRSLQLYAEGKEQAIMVTGSQDGWFDAEDAIEFYGTGLDTPYTDTRVYWLVAGARSGKRIQVARDRGHQRAPSSFPFAVEVKERTFFFAALKNGEANSFFGSVVSTDPVDQLITVPHVAPSAPEEAQLEVALQGATDFPHSVKILLNDSEVGETFVNGQKSLIVEIAVSQDMLLEGDNIVTLASQGGALDVSLVDYIRLTYWRTYTADEDTLRLTAMGGEQLSISGFGSSGIRVVDITHPDNVFKVKGKVIAQDSDYSITISVPGSGERTLLAFAEETVKEAAGLALNQATEWQNRAQGADFVIIAHSDFIQSAQSLKELRELQGLSVELVDVEDLYDEFNYGAKSPWALRDFLARAYENWSPQPRFVLLVGEASFDPRDYLGLGGLDLVPTKLVDTDFMKTASDDWFIDFNDDGLPEMAAGRLPVNSVEEAETMIGKIIAYEDVAGTMNDVLLVADATDIFDYETATVSVAELLPAYMVVSQIFRGQNPQARSDLLDSLNQGQLVVNYIGHGSAETWRGNLFSSEDAFELTNSPYLPFFIGMTCLNGYFHDYYDNLAEALMKAEQGGALAVWTSSGLTEAYEQVIMNQALIKLLFNGEDLTLGEAAVRAKAAVGDQDVRKTWILFGDPTTKIR